MTTIPDTTDNGQTALTAGELNDLQAIKDGKFDDSADYGDDEFKCYTPLWNKGLIARRYEHTYVTDKGIHVLSAQAASEPKPDTSTAGGGGQGVHIRTPFFVA